MEDENRWFNEKKGMPLIEKFAMLFFGFLIAKRAVKAARKSKLEKVKMRWWMLFVGLLMEAIFTLKTGQWDLNSPMDNAGAVLFTIGSMYVYSFFVGKYM